MIYNTSLHALGFKETRIFWKIWEDTQSRN